MAKQAEKFTVPMNQENIETIRNFVNKKGRCIGCQKKGSFLRHIGCDSKGDFLRQLARMDEILHNIMQKERIGYLRVSGFSTAMDKEQAARLGALYDDWQKGSHEDRAKMAFPFTFKSQAWEAASKEGYERVVELFGSLSGKNTPTIIRNFGVKLLYWMEYYYPKLFLQTETLRRFPKLVFCGNIKLQEYLFLYLLAIVGCDVLYLNPAQDVQLDEKVLAFSALTQHSQLLEFSIPEPGSQDFVPPSKEYTIPPAPNRESGKPRMPVAAASAGQGVISAASMPSAAPNPEASEAEMDYVSLAGMAASVVMISTFDNEDKCCQTGSGVIIHGDGYILTNFHVVQGGAYYGIRMEDAEEIYYTSELVKYHNLNDLALLKIDMEQRPIPVFRGHKPLVRGQKVVAIGSPLGLFNSVSDGLIAGFRTVREVPMIQFTAPISNGSSGGALLDLQGRLIGIITAGFDNGQNLNLAVDYETILSFAGGFIK